MRAENPAALRFILQDDVYLLQSDKTLTANTPAAPIEEPLPQPVIAPTVQPVAVPVIKFNYLGKNSKAFLIITHYPEYDFIADAHLTALQSILKRKEYEIDDVAILNLAKINTNINELLTYFSPQKLLILGEAALPAAIEKLLLNQPKQLNNCMVLYSFSFDDMMSSTDNKKAFWDQMKNL